MNCIYRCSVDGCGQTVHARGWCGTHYMRWLKHGDPLTCHVRPKDARCIIADCDGKRFGHGWCQKHYMRWRNNGDPNALLIGPMGKGYRALGYRFIYVDGKRIQEHRHVVEQALGRKLRPEEKVHHINCVKDDNRLENLMVTNDHDHPDLHFTRYRDETSKECIDCHVVLHRSNFAPNNHGGGTDPHQPACRSCQKTRYRLRLSNRG